MQHRANRALTIVALASMTLGLGACAARSGCSASDAETADQVRVIGPSATVGNARHLAHWMERDMELRPGVTATERAEWRAAARELRASADALDATIDRFDAAGSGRGVMLKEIERSAADLEREYETTILEWKRWQGRGG